MLPVVHRPASLAAQGQPPLLGIERRRGPARDADAARRPCLLDGRDRSPQRARREERTAGLVTRHDCRHRQGDSGLGHRQLAARHRRSRHRGGRGPACRIRTRPPASRAGPANQVAAATARPITPSSTASPRWSCCAARAPSALRRRQARCSGSTAGQPSVSIVQPAVSADGSVLIASGDAMGGMGIRLVTVSHTESDWTVQERWTSRALKPYFNDFSSFTAVRLRIRRRHPRVPQPRGR